MTIFVLMPFIGRFQIGHRFNQAFTVLVLLAAVGLTGVALAEDYFVYVAEWMQWTPDDKGNPRHPKELFTVQREQEVDGKKTKVAVDTFNARMSRLARVPGGQQGAEHDAQRTVELINRRENRCPMASSPNVRMIPRQGAVYLLRNDPLTRGAATLRAALRELPRLCRYREAQPVVVRQRAGSTASRRGRQGGVRQHGSGGLSADGRRRAPRICLTSPVGSGSRDCSIRTRSAATDHYGPTRSTNPEIAGDAGHPDNHQRPNISHYFGNTNHKAGRMATWVKQHAELLKDDPSNPDDDLDAIAAALSAQAQLPAQRERDAKDLDSGLIRRGIGLIEQNCTRGCHKFGDSGPAGPRARSHRLRLVRMDARPDQRSDARAVLPAWKTTGCRRSPRTSIIPSGTTSAFASCR